MKQNRNTTIDILRGIAIMLILIGHARWIPPIYNYIFSFHLGLFFIITGLFIEKSADKYTSKKYFLQKIKTILLPYIITLGIWVIWLWIRDSDYLGYVMYKVRFKNYFSAILYSSSDALETRGHSVYLWFLPTFFIFSNILFIIIKYSKKFLIPITITLLIISIIIYHQIKGGMINSTSIWWGIDKLPITLVFGIIGYYISRMITNKRIPQNIFTWSFLISLTSISMNFDLRQQIYPHIILYLIYTVCGFFVTLNISKVIEQWDGSRIKEFLILAGKKTLILYIIHSFTYGIITPMFHLSEDSYFNLNAKIYNIVIITTTISLFLLYNLLQNKIKKEIKKIRFTIMKR